jgi:hypothetical protein
MEKIIAFLNTIITEELALTNTVAPYIERINSIHKEILADPNTSLKPVISLAYKKVRGHHKIIWYRETYDYYFHQWEMDEVSETTSGSYAIGRITSKYVDQREKDMMAEIEPKLIEIRKKFEMLYIAKKSLKKYIKNTSVSSC